MFPARGPVRYLVRTPMGPPAALDAVIERMLEALRLERGELRARLGPLGDKRRVRVVEGVRLREDPGAYAYRFACTLDVPVPEGTSVRLLAEGESASGEVLRHERDEDAIVLALRSDLGPFVPEGWLDFDPTLLLELLASRLRTILEAEAQGQASPWPPFSPALALGLLAGEGAAARAPLHDFEADGPVQRAALERVLAERVAYVWGPPGTGKTRLLARLANALAGRGEQVLLTAHTNVATDAALARALDLSPLPPGAALRLGPCGDALAGRAVDLDAAVDRALRDRAPALVGEMVRVCAAAAAQTPRRAGTLLGEAVPLPRRLRLAASLLEEGDGGDPHDLAGAVAALTTELQRLELAVVAEAKLLATTLTRAATSTLSRSLRPHTVIIDEASMAPLAAAFAAAALARERVVAVGDFLQLAPIAHAAAPLVRRWLGTHVFSSAGCDRIDADHPLRVMLDEQWRMHPQIAAVVSRTFYGGRLRNAPGVASRKATGPVIALADTARTDAASLPSSSGSKINPFHAELVAELAILASAQRDVAVIAPYREHVRRIRNLVRARAPERLAQGRIEVFSVHRFQGRERSLVIFDTVEAPGTPPRFLDELRNAEAPLLLNVALSRAIDHLLLVFHSAHLRSLGPTAALARVLAAARGEGAAEWLVDLPQDLAALQGFAAQGSAA
ncbi:MAG: AAA family ATPase [Myxococcales bacterium]|nr:AAA family ATPase [Myxococcales bacterium]